MFSVMRKFVVRAKAVAAAPKTTRLATMRGLPPTPPTPPLVGGADNAASGSTPTVSGGSSDTASNIGATVAGGVVAIASGYISTVAGGYNNTASGDYAKVAGGRYNRASASDSFAVGKRAKALHTGAFVWADSSNFDFSSNVADQFSARATGGVRFVSAIDGSGNPTAGVTLTAGGGSWSSIGDRAAKENFQAVDGREVLDLLESVPVQTWNYKAQDDSIRHIGPMAQDLYAAFGLGESERLIATIDADGVALAAIQGLYEMVKEKETEIAALRAEKDAQIAGLEGRLAALEVLMSRISVEQNGGGR